MSRINDLMMNMLIFEEGHNRRTNHILKVYALAKTIGENENLDNDTMEIIQCSAILHDIGIKLCKEKYGIADQVHQQLEAPLEAEKILKSLGYEKDFIKRVSYLVKNHHNYNIIDGADYQVLVEADLIINAFEENWESEKMHKVISKTFKTKTGTELAKRMFPNKLEQ